MRGIVIFECFFFLLIIWFIEAEHVTKLNVFLDNLVCKMKIQKLDRIKVEKTALTYNFHREYKCWDIFDVLHKLVKGELKKTYQSFFTITRSNFTKILKSWTFLNSSSSWLLKNVQDHWIWAKFDRDMAKIK